MPKTENYPKKGGIVENYEHEGQLFKALRESRGLTKVEVTKDICSDTTLIKFEKNGSNMGFRTFCQLLQRIGVTLTEFQYSMNYHELDDFKWLLSNVGTCYEEKRIDELRQIVNQLEQELPQKKKVTYQKLNYLMVKTLLSYIDEETTLSEQEKEIIAGQHLFIEHWGYFELTLFANTLDSLEKQNLIVLTRETIARSEFYQAIPENKSLIIQVLLNAMKTLIAEREYSVAKEVGVTIQEMLEDDDDHYTIIHMFTTGALEFSMDNFDVGLELMERAIKIVELLGRDYLVQDYRSTYNTALQHLENIKNG